MHEIAGKKSSIRARRCCSQYLNRTPVRSKHYNQSTCVQESNLLTVKTTERAQNLRVLVVLCAESRQRAHTFGGTSTHHPNFLCRTLRSTHHLTTKYSTASAPRH